MGSWVLQAEAFGGGSVHQPGTRGQPYPIPAPVWQVTRPYRPTPGRGGVAGVIMQSAYLGDKV